MGIVLFDDTSRDHLLPLTFTRPVADIRIGILTIREKWEYELNEKTSSLTQPYLRKKFPLEKAQDNILINGSVLPNPTLVARVNQLQPREALVTDDYIIAIRLTEADLQDIDDTGSEDVKKTNDRQISEINYITFDQPHMKIEFPWQIFKFNREAIADDFARLTKNKKSQPIPDSTTIIGEGPLFVAPGAVVEAATINTKSGPVYIGEDAEVMEGTMIRGPFALCHHSKTKLLTKVYGPVTVGPYSKIGGEVQESVIFGYSNKAHDGFMGNSVIGEWCNLGSDTNTSNLKNTYEPVRLWDYPQESFVQTGEQFIGLIMGDHSKCGINTMFNTGTVVGVSANIFGDGFQRNFVPSFSWGGKAGYTNYKFAKAVQVAKAVFARRNRTFDDTEEALLRSVFDLTLKFRRH